MYRSGSSHIVCALLVGLFGIAPSVSAQSQEGVDAFDIVGAALFARGGDNLTQQQTLALTLGHMIDEITSFPRVTTAGTFRLPDSSESAIDAPPSNGYAGLFTQRAYTVGRGRLDVGINYQRLRWSQLDGLNLTRGIVQDFYRPGDQFTDAARQVTTLTLAYDGIMGIVNYGFTDRIDIGAVVPIATVSVRATEVGRGAFSLPSSTVPNNSLPIAFTNEANTSRTGLGDISAYIKYAALRRRAVAVAAGAEVKASTGSRRDLLGSGTESLRIFGATSLGYGKVAFHLNAGFTAVRRRTFQDPLRLLPLTFDVTTKSPRSAVNYSVATEFKVKRNTSIGVELVGRYVAEAGRVYVTRDYYEPVAPTYYSDSLTVAPFAAMHAVSGSVGFKSRLTHASAGVHLLVEGAITFRLTGDGLVPRPSPVLGMEIGF